jgi:RHS repeat-associated protein
MLTDGRNTYTWNSEDQLKTAAGVTYTYDGDGHRVEKSNGKLYWYGTGSDPLMETDLSGNLTDEYIFFGGKRIARRDSSNNVVYYAADHLGTSRVVASSAGAILDQSDFYPFGGERVLSASSGNTYKFTSKERDTESNLDNFGARYDSSILGRFMSPDSKMVWQKVLASPQDLNLYSYTINNPLRYSDPDGRDWKEVVDKFVNSLTLKVSFGFGLGVKVQAGPAKLDVGVKAKTNLETSPNTNLKVSVPAGAEATLKLPTTPTVGIATPQVNQTLANVSNKDNSVTGVQKPTIEPGSVMVGTQTATGNNSGGDISASAEVGAGFLVGAEVHIDKAEFGSAVNSALNELFPVQPPPATPPPPLTEFPHKPLQ